jgi:chromosome segregation ATPase
MALPYDLPKGIVLKERLLLCGRIETRFRITETAGESQSYVKILEIYAKLLEAKADKHDGRVPELKGELLREKDENDELRRSLDRAGKSLREERKARLEAEELLKQDLPQEIKRAQDRIKGLMAEKTHLESQLSMAQNDAKQRLVSLQEKSKQLWEVKEALAKAKSTNRMLTDQVVELERGLIGPYFGNQMNQPEIARLQRVIGERANRIDELLGEKSIREDQLADAKNVIARQENMIKELKADLELKRLEASVLEPLGQDQALRGIAVLSQGHVLRQAETIKILRDQVNDKQKRIIRLEGEVIGVRQREEEQHRKLQARGAEIRRLKSALGAKITDVMIKTETQ